MPIFRPGLGDDTERRIFREHGYLEYRFGSGGTAELVNMQVDEAHRSKGIGRSMVRELMEEPYVVCVYGFTAESNVRVHKFYRDLEFTLIPLPNYYGWGRNGVMVYRAVK